MEPHGKPRPRFNTRTGRAYADKRQEGWEYKIMQSYLHVTQYCFPADVPLRLDVVAIFPVAKSWTKKRKEAAFNGAIPLCKPDADNILKLVADALNGIAWADDKQVADMTCRKRYVRSENEDPHMDIYITDITP